MPLSTLAAIMRISDSLMLVLDLEIVYSVMSSIMQALSVDFNFAEQEKLSINIKASHFFIKFYIEIKLTCILQIAMSHLEHELKQVHCDGLKVIASDGVFSLLGTTLPLR